jgi:hypothetical protein
VPSLSAGPPVFPIAERFSLEAEKLFAQGVFVSLLGGHYLAANFVLIKVCLLPFIAFSDFSINLP